MSNIWQHNVCDLINAWAIKRNRTFKITPQSVLLQFFRAVIIKLNGK